ncbi:DUF2130 domain-containing protein [Mycoplasmopsis edwardii]|uniref:DUF2130 domain-containing protein n=1 Tax=Mycoplasmopsis edwardii TaxID=53558 RepID=A0ACD4PJH8_9BACT|nr:DUF2130 domain-containing protein [Mycoplasmopsis edwardii]
MFVTRDATFVSLVKLLRMLFNEQVEFTSKEMNLKEKEDIIREFASFFKNNIKNNLELLNSRISNLEKYSNNIQKIQSENWKSIRGEVLETKFPIEIKKY